MTSTDRRARGFTLIELMVVIVILGALVALVAPNVFEVTTESLRGTARAQIGNLSEAVKIHTVERRRLPRSLEELTQADARGGALLPKVPKDPWNGAYDYRILDEREKAYEIRSSGEDAVPGNEDDLIYDSRTGFSDER